MERAGRGRDRAASRDFTGRRGADAMGAPIPIVLVVLACVAVLACIALMVALGLERRRGVRRHEQEQRRWLENDAQTQVIDNRRR
jgi:multisubunit Na+/H+ antiporter MnhC subunit